MSRLSDKVETLNVILKAAHTGELSAWPGQAPDSKHKIACDRWSVTLSYNGKEFHTDYHTGLGHRKRNQPVKPNAVDVLYCLLSDATCANGTHKDYCDNLGIDSDSIKGLQGYLTCQQTGTILTSMFGYDLFNELSQLEH